MKVPKLPKLTVEEYMQHEIETGQKYEYHNGDIYALAGGSLEHALLVGNIYSELRNGLRAKKSNCKPITSEAKLHIERQNKYVYPDSMVICGEVERAEGNKNAVCNPVLIVEVLSESTSEYDRGDKFYFYRQIPTLQEYVLIEQNRYVVEVYSKKEKSDLWKISRYEGPEQSIILQSLDIEIKMSDLYFDIDFKN